MRLWSTLPEFNNDTYIFRFHCRKPVSSSFFSFFVFLSVVACRGPTPNYYVHLHIHLSLSPKIISQIAKLSQARREKRKKMKEGYWHKNIIINHFSFPFHFIFFLSWAALYLHLTYSTCTLNWYVDEVEIKYKYLLKTLVSFCKWRSIGGAAF